MQLTSIAHVDHALMPMIAEGGMVVDGTKISAVPLITIEVAQTLCQNLTIF